MSEEEKTRSSIIWIGVSGASARVVIYLLVALLSSTGVLGAQESPESSTVVFVGAGVARGGLNVPSWNAGYGYGYGPVLVLQVSKVKGPWRTWAWEVQAEPFKTPNVVDSEHFSALTAMAHRYFKPFALAAGIQFRSWGGEHSSVSSDWGPVLGVGLAPKRIELGGTKVTGDLLLRVSGGDEIETSFVGLRVLVQLPRGGG